jgi:hypothetical protein
LKIFAIFAVADNALAQELGIIGDSEHGGHGAGQGRRMYLITNRGIDGLADGDGAWLA